MKKVALLGDSIRLWGYGKKIDKYLGEDYEIFQSEDNCRFAKYMLRCLFDWKAELENCDVIHFNCGHWDAAHWDDDAGPLTTVEEYARNVRLIIRRIRRYWPETKIVFATTTAMNPSGKQGRNKRTTESIRAYNAAAVKVAREEGVAVNDLFALVEKWPASDYKDYCHYSKAASKRLGGIVAERLAKETGL
jgi:lysophospholipase L1-like esterase